MIPFWKKLFPGQPQQQTEQMSPLDTGMDDVTQTLLVPQMDEPDDDDAARGLSTGIAEVASYMSVGTRRNQQDSVCFDGSEERVVCVLCDGMGGLSGGERASALAAEGMTDYLMKSRSEDIPTEMGRAALKLNAQVRELRDEQNRRIEAGTTLTVVFVRGGELYWSNVGDSHIYLWRDGAVQQLNLDHNLGVHLDQLVREGSLSQAEAQRHPQRAALTSYLGIEELSLIGGNRRPMALQPGDILLQCSDGLYRCLSDERIAQLLSDAQDLPAAAKKLVDTALLVPGSHDNTTVVLTRIRG